MFMIFMHLYLYMDSGSHLSKKKTRHGGVHVHRNMHTNVGVLVYVPIHTSRGVVIIYFKIRFG